MTLDFDVSNDMDYFDWVSVGTYYSRGPNDVFTSHPSIVCLRRAFDRESREASPAQVERQSTIWHIKKNTLSITPAFRDRIVDDTGINWAVQNFSSQTFDSRLRLICIRVKDTLVMGGITATGYRIRAK